ncbi:hypothetical protein B0A48_08040 [Cryoendolithus antarcticus]|uniref:Calcium-channel protein CCH1 n=1 Tax=Cryoendolithus antarcticus TaxID=1507870 RepID=A0A1V8T117_9PEZI|nr:hypothetical protein B0A48_08040 [Cryoendolithus antarcticus]
MASEGDEGSQHRRGHSDNGIPLQTLGPSGLPITTDLNRNDTHRRTLSDRGRALFASNRQAAARRERDGRYAPIREGSPSPPLRTGGTGGPLSPQVFVSSPSGERERVPDEEDEAPFSPILDTGAFQAAIGFAGLSFNAGPLSPEEEQHDDVEDTPPRNSRGARASRDILPRLSTSAESATGTLPVTLNDGPEFFSPGGHDDDEDDTVPLNDNAQRHTSDLLSPSTPHGQRHDRDRRSSSHLSVKFPSSLRPKRSQRHSRGRSDNGARLGDDLHDLEDGSHATGSSVGDSPSGRKRSLSPSSRGLSLQRTGTMLRKMSQRVVNLSHEPEVEPEVRRKSSVKADSDEPAPTTPLGEQNIQLHNLDGHSSPTIEKTPSPVSVQMLAELPARDWNPLRGKSLGIFTKDSRVRKGLLEFLVNPIIEPLILLLIVVQAVVLAVDAARDVYTDPRPSTSGNKWTDYTLLGIFGVYTIETTIKIIVSGFILNPEEYSTIDRRLGLRLALSKKANDMFALHRKPSMKHAHVPLTDEPAPPSLLRSFTAQGMVGSEDVPGGSRAAQKKRLAHRAYLRHSFNRLDFVAVVSFWISFLLGAVGIEWGYRLYVFRMMSCLRILRLLNITSGTLVILRSLKRAAPTLLNVAILISFFWLLFAIVGVQSFKSSLRRTCVWDGSQANPQTANYTSNAIGSFQFCGGWKAANQTDQPWLTADGIWGANEAKGYICPVGSWCVEGGNPYNNTVSFDNIGNSLEMVFVIMTSNTFSDIMYYLTESDYLAAAIFYAVGIMIMSLWLINLLIAVITSSFQVIREESSRSAFMAVDHAPTNLEAHEASKKRQRLNSLQRFYGNSKWIWIAVIVYGLVVQSLRHSTMSPGLAAFIDASELGVTLVLDGEIILRFVCDWRGFRHQKTNWVDLTLAVITSVLQLPVVHRSGTPYAWLSVFQILRIYRVVLAVRITRDLIMLVLRHVSGIANLILFVFLLTFLAAIFATQLFRGTLPEQDDTGTQLDITFATIYNAFLGMYQILSSENWTVIMYNVTRFSVAWDMAWIGAAFFILWFILGNFIVLNMFIAVIQENFDVSEDQKRLQQVRSFLQQKEMGSSSHGTLSLSRIFNLGQARRQDPLDFGNAASEMLLNPTVVKDFLDEIEDEDSGDSQPSTARMQRLPTMHLGTTAPGFWSAVYGKTVGRVFKGEPNPFYSRPQFSKPFDQLDPRTLAREVWDAEQARKVTQKDYLRAHPTYNKSLYLFTPDNPIRRACQRLVGPGRGSERIQGAAPNPMLWYISSAFLYVAIVAMVLIACITTPLYQKEYFDKHGYITMNWFMLADIGFAALFTIEAVIKVIADGFFFTPNAYLRSSWGFIDGVVLVTLWTNVIASLYGPGDGSRAVGAFKALRALRLLNVSDSARDTFHSIIVLGGWKVVSAAFVSLSLLIPFAVYGLNLFAGQMMSCNDGNDSIYNLTDCVGEFISSPYGWDVLAPRVVENSYFDFDSFGGSLFILFQIVSQEGWVDVMNAAESITGIFTQPSLFASQGNAIFFVVFNLLGAVFVLTLFVSVFMRNYTEQTGVAFLTTDQRSWLELRKLLRQVAPSKRPNHKKEVASWQKWCYRRATTKTGGWQRGVTVVLCLHLALLCTEYYPEPKWWSITRDIIFMAFTLLYIANIVIRIIGLSWTRFRKSAWDVFSLIAVSATFIFTVLLWVNLENTNFAQVHKIFLVSLALLLIPRNNQLDQLFKTAAASLTSIVNLLATWFVLFLVFAIALTQTFGLTRFAKNETGNINVRTVPKALILLFRTSVGEGWNQVMEDYASVVPPYCTVGEKFYDGDCGSPEWARAIFILWNILSMYIFVNLFISLIYESFSYVYQRSSGLSIISREEIRRFKQAWAEYDPDGSGYISKEVFPRFLGELSGVFEMRIYDGDYTVGALIASCRKQTLYRTTSLPLDGASIHESNEIDLEKLNAKLNEIPVHEIRRRRARMNIFYEEILNSADLDRGIPFNALLMILAHYKVINDNKSLKLDEFLRRRARLQRVEEAVNRNVVAGFFDTLYWSRKFRRAIDGKQAARMTAVPTFGVPEIFVHDMEGNDISQAKAFTNIPSVSVTPVDGENPWDAPGPSSLGIDRFPSGSGTGSDAGSHAPSSGEAAGGLRNRSSSIQMSPQPSPTTESFPTYLRPSHRPSASQSSIQPDWHFAAALDNAGTGVSPPGSPRSSEGGARSRAGSAVSQGDMMGMFGSSAWGESVRRSATQRKGSEGRSPGAG